jgi:hypothetical protein
MFQQRFVAGQLFGGGGQGGQVKLHGESDFAGVGGLDWV